MQATTCKINRLYSGKQTKLKSGLPNNCGRAVLAPALHQECISSSLSKIMPMVSLPTRLTRTFGTLKDIDIVSICKSLLMVCLAL
jgi:hypothetical protein